ncbi:MAG: hypothetical protein HXX13_10720 [Bacteroidetes bacterium]|nr:hypothetical protein [Bacteroidota bacterium]
MKTFRLDKSYGPTGSSAGILLFLAGIFILFSSVYGVIPLVLGAFVGLSSTCATIDPGSRRIKFSNMLFGVIPIGKWISVDDTMHVGIKESAITWSAFSRGNRQLDVPINDYRIVLYDAGHTKMMDIQKERTLDAAKTDLETLANQFGISAV